MSLRCSAAASGAQPKVSEEYEKLDGVKVWNESAMLWSRRCAAGGTDFAATLLTLSHGHAGVAGVRTEAGADHGPMGRE